MTTTTRRYDCSVLTQTETAALHLYAARHGRTWKSALRRSWERACTDLELALASPLLRVRSKLGPSGLRALHLSGEGLAVEGRKAAFALYPTLPAYDAPRARAKFAADLPGLGDEHFALYEAALVLQLDVLRD